MSFLGKKWVVQNESPDLNVIAKLLQNRGIDSNEKAELFFKGGSDHLHDPMLLKDIDKAIERIQKAVADGEKMMIFGDYDVDGITGTAILYDFLKKIGADVHYTLPHREDDGYGLKSYFIDHFKEQDVKLLITVDCGTSNLEEIKHGNSLGIDTVVTDHHSMPKELPPAVAVVNPHRTDCDYPNKEICGSSIAYKLVSAMAPLYWSEAEANEYLTKQLSITALGVVGDCMALTGENRILVREGLKRLMAGDNPGILALLKEAGQNTNNITSMTIGFQIGPRINAAGRLDKPDHAFELLIGNLEKAIKLNELNEERRSMTKEYVDEAIMQVEQMEEMPGIIVVSCDQWKPGLIGLVASQISDKYSRPTIAMSDRGDELVASMRSLNDFDITGALRDTCSDLFTAFGGHAMAGGFTLPKKNLGSFLDTVKTVGSEQICPTKFMGTLSIDCEINPAELTFETRSKLDHLEPFGAENPQPTLLLKGAKILSMRPVGKGGEHLQFPVKIKDQQLNAIAFRFGHFIDRINPAIPHDLVVNLELNEWNGQRKLQLRVVDMRPTE